MLKGAPVTLHWTAESVGIRVRRAGEVVKLPPPAEMPSEAVYDMR
jgi:hypothetical protein